MSNKAATCSCCQCEEGDGADENKEGAPSKSRAKSKGNAEGKEKGKATKGKGSKGKATKGKSTKGKGVATKGKASKGKASKGKATKVKSDEAKPNDSSSVQRKNCGCKADYSPQNCGCNYSVCNEECPWEPCCVCNTPKICFPDEDCEAPCYCNCVTEEVLLKCGCDNVIYEEGCPCMSYVPRCLCSAVQAKQLVEMEAQTEESNCDCNIVTYVEYCPWRPCYVPDYQDKSTAVYTHSKRIRYEQVQLDTSIVARTESAKLACNNVTCPWKPERQDKCVAVYTHSKRERSNPEVKFITSETTDPASEEKVLPAQTEGIGVCNNASCLRQSETRDKCIGVETKHSSIRGASKSQVHFSLVRLEEADETNEEVEYYDAEGQTEETHVARLKSFMSYVPSDEVFFARSSRFSVKDDHDGEEVYQGDGQAETKSEELAEFLDAQYDGSTTNSYNSSDKASSASDRETVDSKEQSRAASQELPKGYKTQSNHAEAQTKELEVDEPEKYGSNKEYESPGRSGSSRQEFSKAYKSQSNHADAQMKELEEIDERQTKTYGSNKEYESPARSGSSRQEFSKAYKSQSNHAEAQMKELEEIDGRQTEKYGSNKEYESPARSGSSRQELPKTYRSQSNNSEAQTKELEEIDERQTEKYGSNKEYESPARSGSRRQEFSKAYKSQSNHAEAQMKELEEIDGRQTEKYSSNKEYESPARSGSSRQELPKTYRSQSNHSEAQTKELEEIDEPYAKKFMDQTEEYGSPTRSNDSSSITVLRTLRKTSNAIRESQVAVTELPEQPKEHYDAEAQTKELEDIDEKYPEKFMDQAYFGSNKDYESSTQGTQSEEYFDAGRRTTTFQGKDERTSHSTEEGSNLKFDGSKIVTTTIMMAQTNHTTFL